MVLENREKKGRIGQQIKKRKTKDIIQTDNEELN